MPDDSVIAEMGQRILDWRQPKEYVHAQDLRRWAEHLRSVVQPQLDELAQMKAAATRPAKKGSDHAGPTTG